MVYLLLAPYNDSIQLGQGFNSFLHKPCIAGAVDIPAESLHTQAVRAGGPANVSQTVSYSSRFVEKISDVVRSMNISAASSIKSGTIEVSGNSLSVDEAKFAASDLNAVISVKVVNQTTTTLNNPEFVPLKDVSMTSESFFEIFGDCYVSGFMEGGDLHGIVSVKVLDSSKKSEVESILKGEINGSANSGDFTLGEGSGLSTFNYALSQTETTVTVNWSGGGQIKADSEEWTLDSLLRAAAAFPSRVASCPQRTWAVLTRYDNNRSFVRWAKGANIVVPDFNRAQQITTDLLDDFMEHKHNLSRLQAVMANPALYSMADTTSLFGEESQPGQLQQAEKPVGTDVMSLVAERKLIKDEMKKISDSIDALNRNPQNILTYNIKNPILWACRLPVLIQSSSAGESGISSEEVADIFRGFSIVNEPPVAEQHPIQQPTPSAAPSVAQAVKTAIVDVTKTTTNLGQDLKAVAPPPSSSLCVDGITKYLTQEELAWVNAHENKTKFEHYKFDRPVGHGDGPFFNYASYHGGYLLENFASRYTAFFRPRENRRVVWTLGTTFEHYGHLDVFWDTNLWDQNQPAAAVSPQGDERVIGVKIGLCPESWGVKGICYLEFTSSTGKSYADGEKFDGLVSEYTVPKGCEGLKGWWGHGSKEGIYRLGPIWGHKRA
ncbi:hypothetical protein HD806DRAFT_416024 [Xylariaceae sp. AK1471]|nr:hypothetical protein HD806DRAFT_416024 [Xylariaceae sp. AK1471]